MLGLFDVLAGEGVGRQVGMTVHRPGLQQTAAVAPQLLHLMFGGAVHVTGVYVGCDLVHLEGEREGERGGEWRENCDEQRENSVYS